MILDFGFRILDLETKTNKKMILDFRPWISDLRIKFHMLLLGLFLLTAFVNPLKAQTVDSLVNEAIKNNPQLKALEARIKSAEYRSNSVGYLPPPTVGIEFSQVPFEDPNPFTQAISQNLSISQMFMLGGKLGAMEEAERKGISVAEAEYHVARLQLMSDVKTKYYQVWMLEHHLGLRDELITLLKNLLQSSEQLYTTGRTKYSDVLMIKAELASNETQSKILENDLAAEIYEMNALLGRDIKDDNLSISHTWKTDSLTYSAEELSELLLSSNPELDRMQQMIEMNRLEITANNKELIPDLMIQGMLMRMPRGMILTTKTPVHELEAGMGETEYMYSFMASVTLPFMPWSSGRVSAREEELNAEISGLSSERNNMQRRMTAQLNGMIEKLKSAQNQITLYSGEVIPLYRQALQAQVSEFTNAQISINDIISTMQMLIMKEEEMSEAQMQNQMVLAEIETMVGKKLKKISE